MKIRCITCFVFGSFLYFVLSSPVSAVQGSFSDVPMGSPYFEHIEYLKRNKIILGFKDGTFGISKTAKRGEFLKVLITALHNKLVFLDTESPMPLFKDVRYLKTAWASPYVVTAKIDQLIKGNKDGEIQLGKEVTRAEAITMVVRVLNYQTSHFKDVQLPYRDAKKLDWYTPSLRIVFQQNLLVARGFKFYPEKKITRAEMAELLYRAIVQKQKHKKFKNKAFDRTRLTALSGAEEAAPAASVDDIPPYREGERAMDFASSSPIARSDLIITEVAPTGPGDGIYQGALKITVENAGDAAVEGANFCVMSRPDWYNYKPGFNSASCVAGSAETLPILYPDKNFVFYVWGECDQTYHKTSEILFVVDPNFIPAENLLDSAGFASPHEYISQHSESFDIVKESDELNNEYIYQCLQ